MHDRLTTTDTGHYAGVWYELPDGTPRYFTREHVAHMERLNAQRSTLTQSNVHAIQQAHRDTSVAIRVSDKGKAVAQPWQQHRRTCVAPGCDRTFTPKNPRHLLCGADKCRDAHKAAKRKQYNAKYDAKRKRTKGVAA